MFYLGIDVSQKTHRFVLLDDQGEKLTKPFTIQNTQEHFQELLQRLEALNLSPDNTLAGLEATGSCWENLYCLLTEKGYRVILINPYQTNKFREALRKKAKTDDIDALIIAGLLRSGHSASSYVPDEQDQTLRELTKMRYQFLKTTSARWMLFWR